MRSFLSLMALGFLFVGAVAVAEEPAAVKKTEELEVAKTGDGEVAAASVVEAEESEMAEHKENTLLRLKSGVAFLQDSSALGHVFPVSVDWEYLGLSPVCFGLSMRGMRGSNTIGSAEFRKTMALVQAGADYRWDLGSTRVLAGMRLGILFNDESSTGSAPALAGRENVTSSIAVSPVVNVDFPIQGPFFVNVGADYLFGKSLVQYGSLFAGVGADF